MIGIYDAALLVETGIYKEFDGLIVVHCSVETQIERTVARDGCSREEAQARIDAQLPMEEKVAVADYTISSEGTLVETKERARIVWETITRP